MDPSHARKYSDREIEIKALQILKEEYPDDISTPVDIDQIVYKHDLIDDIVPIELLEDKFEVAALLLYKPNGKLDILIDEDTFDRQGARANFSIAHEFGHVVLHQELWTNCTKIEDSINLHKRIETRYSTIEWEANRFAGALLMPRNILIKDAQNLYLGFVRLYGFDLNLIPQKIYAGIAKGYHVSVHSASVRLNELKLTTKIQESINYKLPYLEF